VKAVRDNVQSGKLLTLSLVAGRLSRLTGIEFQNRGRINTANAPGGILDVDGSNTNGNTLNTITYTVVAAMEHQVCRSARVIFFEIAK
jgi:hypothetical protein